MAVGMQVSITGGPGGFPAPTDHGIMPPMNKGDIQGNQPIEVRPLTPARWPDVEAIFKARGCAVARGCWCMYYRESGTPPPTPGSTRRQARQAGLQRLASQDPPPGLVGYRHGIPVGWISLGPRDDFAKLTRSPVMKAVDDRPVWSIVCFVVPSEHRHRGVARALLDGAIEYARGRGVTLLEAYPVDKTGTTRDDALWFGTKSMYDQAGFVEVARRKPTRPVVRLALANAGARKRGRR
jgi:GNAT superfamily N-acetyltransferase